MRTQRRFKVVIIVLLGAGLLTSGLQYIHSYGLSGFQKNSMSSVVAAVVYTTFSLILGPLLAFLVRLSKASRLSLAPCWSLRRFAEVCFSKKTFTQILEPALSDMEKEHNDALFAGRPWQARMALVRGYWAFWSAVIAQLPISLARRVYEVWKTTNTGN